LPAPLRRDHRSAQRGGLRRGPATPARYKRSHGRARHRPSRQVPRCRGPRDRRAAQPARSAERPAGARGAGRWAAQRPCRAEGLDRRTHDHRAPARRPARQGADMSRVKVTTLANGLHVAVDEMPEVESASLGIWVACGTRHESAELNGMAHMLEHMAFKGTRTRSARAIAEEIENVGGSLNAYTGREITAYHASVLKEDTGLGIELVADILRNSVFDPDELQRERGVILQEIGQALDTPDD